AGLVLIGPVGQGDYARQVMKAAGRLSGRVALVGQLGRPQISRTLRNADVHGLPSLFELASIANLEAAASGCEIVVTPASAMPDYLGSDAHIATSMRPHDVAVALQAALSRPRQPHLRSRVERYDWVSSAKALAKAYRQALG
ncbi:MAG TPA: glycosyltransferase, partial [Acidimicrobiales bacterium]